VEAAVSRDGRIAERVTITNYERLEKFDTAAFGGVVCDESSAIKAFDGKRRAIVTEFLRTHKYRLLCTATAAPNDYIELGTSSEALGRLGHMDMLARFFTNKTKSSAPMGGRFGRTTEPPWRFKGHAEEAFWQWVASWARAIRRPSDLGFADTGFELPPLEQHQHVIGGMVPPGGAPSEAVGLREERAEARRTLIDRCEQAAVLLAGAGSAVAWCQLNDESMVLSNIIGGAVEVSGSDSIDAKEEALTAFSRGEIRVLVTKPSIGGWGLNWQHCNRMTFFPSHSFEQYYQAIRRCWRFGQTRPVQVHIVTTSRAGGALASLQRKSLQADRMFEALTTHMRNATHIDRSHTYDLPVEVPKWAC
jgi:hypothetical protein